MNVAFYDLPRQELQMVFESASMTPDGLRQFSLHAQVQALEEGVSLNGIMVGWQPDSDYFGVFLLGDMAEKGLPETVLNHIEKLARSQ
jgi:hypothetical protein